MKTNHPNYEDAFEKVIEQRNTLKAAAAQENTPLVINISLAEQEELLN